MGYFEATCCPPLIVNISPFSNETLTVLFIIFKEVKPQRVPAPSGMGMIDDYWGPSLKLLSDIRFLENLMNFDKDNIPTKVMDKLRHQILNDENFDPDKIKTASTAAEGAS